MNGKKVLMFGSNSYLGLTNHPKIKEAAIEAVKKSKTPTLFIHGEKDTFVPFSMMDRLYNACAAEKDKISIPEAEHAVSIDINPKLYWEKVFEFTEKYV